jgi:hypothetical protein
MKLPELATIPWSYRAAHQTINPPTIIPALLTTAVAPRALGAHPHSVATVRDLVKVSRLLLSQIGITPIRISHHHQEGDLAAGLGVALAVADYEPDIPVMSVHITYFNFV